MIEIEGDGPSRNETWGKWRFDEAPFQLVHTIGYFVNLAEMKDSANVLDWIAQLSNKSWAEPEDIGHFVRALDELMDLQANVCSYGSDGKLINVKDLVTRRRHEPDLD
jgi:hypothetical protein